VRYCRLHGVTDEIWRPWGFEAEDAATYDALHEDVPPWLAESFWDWVRVHMTTRESGSYGGSGFDVFQPHRLREIERICRIHAPYKGESVHEGMRMLRRVSEATGAQLRVADYLLSIGCADTRLSQALTQAGSAWTVGERAGRPGLVRRVPEGVQLNADSVMANGGRAGARLAEAWERAFGISPDPTGAYALAVRAVEDAAIPAVVPRQDGATLGHVIGQLRSDGDWSLPLTREASGSPTSAIVLSLCGALWHGHHDRHGGREGPDVSCTVSQEEAEVAVTIAVTLVQWFSRGLVARR